MKNELSGGHGYPYLSMHSVKVKVTRILAIFAACAVIGFSGEHRLFPNQASFSKPRYLPVTCVVSYA